MRTIRIFAIIFLGIVIFYLSLSVEKYFYRKEWEKETSPLPKEIVSDLCNRFLLSSDDSLCNGSRDVYALDFSNVLREYFPLEDPMETPKENSTITYHEVELVIGRYSKGCQDVVYQEEPDIDYFRCFYDFRGDGYQREVFYFYYPENTLFSIRSGTGSSD